MKTLTYLLAFSMLLASCAGHRKLAQASASADGTSFEKAIFITETHESTGVDAEYAWIQSKYPGYHTRGQALVYNKNKPFDIIHITTADGTNMDVYFDISNYFGKL